MSVLNSVNNIWGTDTKLRIDAELVGRFLNQRMRLLLLEGEARVVRPQVRHRERVLCELDALRDRLRLRAQVLDRAQAAPLPARARLLRLQPLRQLVEAPVCGDQAAHVGAVHGLTRLKHIGHGGLAPQQRLHAQHMVLGALKRAARVPPLHPVRHREQRHVHARGVQLLALALFLVLLL